MRSKNRTKLITRTLPQAGIAYARLEAMRTAEPVEVILDSEEDQQGAGFAI